MWIHDWGLRIFLVCATMVLGLAPLFAETSVEPKAATSSAPMSNDGQHLSESSGNPASASCFSAGAKQRPVRFAKMMLSP